VYLGSYPLGCMYVLNRCWYVSQMARIHGSGRNGQSRNCSTHLGHSEIEFEATISMLVLWIYTMNHQAKMSLYKGRNNQPLLA
jgi:hypothetical protein